MESLAENDFFFALVIFVSQIWIFTNLGRFGEGFGKVLGVFGEDFRGFGGRFLEVLRNTSLVFGNGSSHAFQNNHGAKIIKREQVAPLEACVASLRAVLIYNLSTFDRFETPCFCIRFFTEIEVCGFPKISNATETLLVSSVWVTPGRTIWQLSFWNKYH